jgi:ribosome biogenesis protein ENP2
MVDKMLKRQERRDKIDEGMGVLGDDRFGKLFEDEEFAVDENSREFQMLNPSTRMNGNAADITANGDTDGSDISGDEVEEIGAKSNTSRKSKPEMRISSSSYKKSGHQGQDKALGSIMQGKGRITKSRVEVTGERQVTFAPTPTRTRKERPASARKGRRDEGRRSASGNVFRKM